VKKLGGMKILVESNSDEKSYSSNVKREHTSTNWKYESDEHLDEATGKSEIILFICLVQ